MKTKKLSFSVRQGYQPIQPIQTESISEILSADIFNFLWSEFFAGVSFNVNQTDDVFDDTTQDENFRIAWTKFFHQSASDFAIGVSTSRLRIKYDSITWNEKYDFLEFCVMSLQSESSVAALCKQINSEVLEPNNSGYRFIKGILTPISSEVSKKSIETVMQTDTSADHIQKAVKELSKRKNRNTNQIAAEAITGVESATKEFVQSRMPEIQSSNKSLGQLLRIIKDNNLLTSNPAYSESMSKLYGYLSNNGVRHGNLPDKNSNISLSEAIYILETCSAFINYLSANLAD